MTVEHRLVLGLQDIRAVTLECVGCGARLSIAPDKLDVSTLRECPACAEDWLQTASGTARHVEWVPLTKLLDALAGAVVSEKNDTHGVRVLFEFAEPTP